MILKTKYLIKIQQGAAHFAESLISEPTTVSCYTTPCGGRIERKPQIYTPSFDGQKKGGEQSS